MIIFFDILKLAAGNLKYCIEFIFTTDILFFSDDLIKINF